MPFLPSRRLAGLVLLAGAVFLFSTPIALLLDLFLLLLVTAEVIVLHRTPRVHISRIAPNRVPLDGTACVDLTIHNRADRSLTLEWTDDLEAGLGRAGSDVRTATINPQGELRQSYLIAGEERGRRRLGDVHLRILGPAGLIWQRIRVPMEAEIVVQPGLLQLRHNRQVALHSRREIGRRRTRELGEGREFERLREYVRGDDTRRIDWKATAKRGQTIVREFAAERSQSIVIAIDAGRLMAERFDGRERLDHALAAALVLADAASVHGDSIGLLVFADSIQTYLPPARLPLARIADALADVRSVRAEPDYPSALGQLGKQLGRRSLIVLFSDAIDARASAALIAHLTASTRRHLPLLIAMRNSEVEVAARAPVRTEEGAYRRAAAEEMLQTRSVALAAIRRRGVLVADIRPQEAVTEAVARYLEVKQRGRL